MDKNVYTAGVFETRRPVWGDEFHDRTGLLEQLGGLVEAHLEGRPSWVVLMGPRKIGKTSILKELQRRVEGRQGMVATMDLFKVDARVQDVFTALLCSLLSGACSAAGHEDLARRLRLRPGPPDGELAYELSGALPMECVGRTLGLLDALQARQVKGADVEEALDMPERFAQHVGPVWMIIDEFQELAALGRQRPFSKRHTVFRLMRSVWQDHQRVSYWATGSQVSMLTSLFSGRRAPLHGHFRLVPVGPFERDTAAHLLLRRTDPSLQGKESGEAAALAAEALGDHPFYIQMLGEELQLRRVRLTFKGVKSVLQEIMLSPAGRLALHLQGVIKADAGSGQQLAVLRALSRGEATLAELVKANRSLTRESTHALLRRLEGADLVSRDRQTHRFRVFDPALAAYLRMGGLAAEPSPAVLGDEGEKAAARHLMAQGIRPVYQSYRSLGPADLVTLEPRERLAIQVKRTGLPIYFTEPQYRRMEHWARQESLLPVLCQVDPGETGIVRYWKWSAAKKAGKRRRFDETGSVASVLELLK